MPKRERDGKGLPFQMLFAEGYYITVHQDQVLLSMLDPKDSTLHRNSHLPTESETN